MKIHRWVGVLLLALLGGCEWSEAQKPVPPSSGRYQLHAVGDEKVLRLDTQTGQVSVVTEKGLFLLADDRRVVLKVGEIYGLEGGKTALYMGGDKLETNDQAIADALVKKYSTPARLKEGP